VDSARNSFDDTLNDLAKGGIRLKRKTDLCATFKNTSISNWIGTIDTLSSVASGGGIVKVKIGDHATLTTVAHVFDGNTTLIVPGTDLFNQLSRMKEGVLVRIEGQFLKDDSDCFEETSITMTGSVKDPAFSFRFVSLQTVE
jgi:hypothetical protein